MKMLRCVVRGCVVVAGVLLLAAWAAASAGAEEAEGEILQRITDAWKARRQGIESIRYEIEGTETYPKGALNGVVEGLKESSGRGKDDPPLGDAPPQDTALEFRQSWLIDLGGDRIRKDSAKQIWNGFKQEFGRLHEIFAFDGKTVMRHRSKVENSMLNYADVENTPEYTIVSPETGMGMFLTHTDQPVYWSHGIPTWGEKLASLSTPADFGEFSVRQTVLGSDGSLERVFLRRERPLKGLDHEIRTYEDYEIDLTREGQVLSVSGYRGEQLTHETKVQYQQTEGGWLPLSWNFSAYDMSDKLLMSLAYEVTEYEICPRLDDGQFTFDPPPGSVIMHENGDLVRVGEDGSSQGVKRRHIPAVTGEQGLPTNIWIRFVVPALLLAIVAFACLRRWKWGKQ
jgi:hypothetical protein